MLRFILFLAINFGALAIGSLLMGNPATNQWYLSLNKAPWTPPGWVFGAAWTVIMLCFSIFLWHTTRQYPPQKFFYVLFAVQFVLNVLWNPVFFSMHHVAEGLAIILLLTALVGWFTYYGFKYSGVWGLLMVPYFIWLCIASSLNWYVLVKN